MSTPEAQISQFKDALKLMKKKCTVLEGKLNGIHFVWMHNFIESKAQTEASRLLLFAFLEYIRGPFSGKVERVHVNDRNQCATRVNV